MENDVTLLIQALAGTKALDGGKREPGAIIALRRSGDECLYVPDTEEEKGMEWIPVGQFSIDPDALGLPEPVETGSETETEPVSGEAPVEQPAQTRRGPFGKRRQTSTE